MAGKGGGVRSRWMFGKYRNDLGGIRERDKSASTDCKSAGGTQSGIHSSIIPRARWTDFVKDHNRGCTKDPLWNTQVRYCLGPYRNHRGHDCLFAPADLCMWPRCFRYGPKQYRKSCEHYLGVPTTSSEKPKPQPTWHCIIGSPSPDQSCADTDCRRSHVDSCCS